MTDITARGRRTELRRQRRQRQRRLLAGVLAIALVVLAVATYALTRSDRTPRATLAKQSRTQSTVLFQVQGESGAAVGSALLAHDPASRSGAAVLVPPQVIVTVPGTGTLQLGRALSSVPPARSRAALADLMGVTVDAGWVINIPTLTALIDQVGGVTVDVDVPVVVNRTVVLSPGSQRVDGERATQFLRYLASGEQEQSRLARLQEVFDGLLAALPRATAQVTTALAGLGPRSDSSIPVPRLAAFLVGLATDSRDDALQYDTLPVIAIDPGDGVTSFRIDPDSTRALVDRLLAQSVPPSARQTGNRVLVLNGVGTPGLGEKVRAKLVPNGFVFVGSRNNASFGVTNTRVLVKEATPEAQALGAKVAKALGVGEDAVQTADLGSIADVVVVVGSDFRAGT
ncbi:MAG: cell envelope-related transcriptional attenuator [Frankiales bacterium]|jgi:anionic cell wall polymer biosynthesis LytR-Cps2A-Psr (LCP) family protein|nr:cell envelope-related transcriptional attenuator [Frankiales bacterium]